VPACTPDSREIVVGLARAIHHNRKARIMKPLILQITSFEKMYEVVAFISSGQHRGPAHLLFFWKRDGMMRPPTAKLMGMIRLPHVDGRLQVEAIALGRKRGKALMGRAVQVLLGPAIIDPGRDRYYAFLFPCIRIQLRYRRRENMAGQS
jgi:hypothetical protein